MSDEFLPDDVKAMLAAERRRPALDDAHAGRIRAAVSARVAHPPPSPWPSRAGWMLAGVVAGALGHALLRAPRAVTVERVRVELRYVVADAGVVAHDATDVTNDAGGTDAAPAAHRDPVVDTAGLRAAERALIERARSALARAEHAGGMEAVLEHARRFPRGALVEEREALRVRLLSASGRSAEARARAEDFLLRWPRSLFAPAVRALAPP